MWRRDKTRLKNPDAVNPAIALLFHSKDHWHGISDPFRSAAHIFMEYTLTILLSGFLLCGCSQKQASSSGPANDPVQSGKPPQSSAALEMAKKIKLSSVYYDGLPLEVVITTLHDECGRRAPAWKGFTISLGPDAKELADTEINLKLTDVTLAETLGRVADSVGLEVQANDTELLLVRKKAKTSSVVPKRSMNTLSPNPITATKVADACMFHALGSFVVSELLGGGA
jgi:hypothetical protein